MTFAQRVDSLGQLEHPLLVVDNVDISIHVSVFQQSYSPIDQRYSKRTYANLVRQCNGYIVNPRILLLLFPVSHLEYGDLLPKNVPDVIAS